MTHKTWAPFAIMGVLIVIIGGFFLLKGEKEEIRDGRSNVAVEKREPVTAEGYQFDMQNAIDTFRANEDGAAFKAELLTIRVPKEYLDLHLAFVGAVDTNESADLAIAEINQLAQTASWLD